MSDQKRRFGPTPETLRASEEAAAIVALDTGPNAAHAELFSDADMSELEAALADALGDPVYDALGETQPLDAIADVAGDGEDNVRQFDIDVDAMKAASPASPLTVKERATPPPLPQPKRPVGPPPLPAAVYADDPARVMNAAAFAGLKPEKKRATPPPPPPEAFRDTKDGAVATARAELARERLLAEAERALAQERERHREVLEVTDTLVTGEKEQRAAAFYAHGRDSATGAEVSLALKRGRKRENVPGEDTVFFDAKTGLKGIADGVSNGVAGEGGEGDGAFASRTAAEWLAATFTHRSAQVDREGIANGLVRFAERRLADLGIKGDNPTFEQQRAALIKTYGPLPREVKAAMIALSDAVADVAAEAITGKKTGDFKGATTLLVSKPVRLPDGRTFEVIAGLGDGRATRVKPNGERRDLVKPHSLLELMRKRGMDVDNPNFTWTHPKTGEVLTRGQLAQATYGGIGAESVEPNIVIQEVHPGETILLESDGQGDNAEVQDRYGSVVQAHTQDARTMAQALTDLTNERHMDTTLDDVSLVATYYPAEEARSAAAA